jgi:CTP synthase (UTP-ammonia lyase)
VHRGIRKGFAATIAPFLLTVKSKNATARGIDMQPVTIGLIGDRRDAVVAHRAIPIALAMAARELGVDVRHEWVPSDEIASSERVARFDGLWCVPGSPYRNLEGVLLAIRYARARERPFVGTCGGFQHAVLEYARNALGWRDADHAESSPGAERAVISPLACGALREAGPLKLIEGTRLERAYGRLDAAEEYQCNFGVNPAFRAALVTGAMRESAVDADGDLRAVELVDHPFFVCTLFQPERAALHGKTPPLVTAFLAAVVVCTVAA